MGFVRFRYIISLDDDPHLRISRSHKCEVISCGDTYLICPAQYVIITPYVYTLPPPPASTFLRGYKRIQPGKFYTEEN